MSRRAIAVNPTAARAYLASQVNTPTFSAFQQYCNANGHDSGQISRVRWSVLYSSVFVQWSAAGVPTLTSNRLYAQPLGSTDATAGVLTDNETNLSQAGKMPNGQSFAAKQHGFDLYLHTLGAAGPATQILVAQAMMEIANSVTSRLLTGSETSQIWGPIAAHMLGTYAIQALPAAAQASGFPQGNSPRVGVPMTPELVLQPGEAFAVEVNARVPLPTVAAMQGSIVGIRHWFIGETRTAVDG